MSVYITIPGKIANCRLDETCSAVLESDGLVRIYPGSGRSWVAITPTESDSINLNNVVDFVAYAARKFTKYEKYSLYLTYNPNTSYATYLRRSLCSKRVVD